MSCVTKKRLQRACATELFSRGILFGAQLSLIVQSTDSRNGNRGDREMSKMLSRSFASKQLQERYRQTLVGCGVLL